MFTILVKNNQTYETDISKAVKVRRNEFFQTCMRLVKKNCRDFSRFNKKDLEDQNKSNQRTIYKYRTGIKSSN